MYDQPNGQGRTQSFQDGTNVGTINTARTVQSQPPKGFQPDSVLHQISQSPNGMSQADANRQLLNGQQLPTQNGMSQQTYQARQPLMNSTRSV